MPDRFKGDASSWKPEPKNIGVPFDLGYLLYLW